MSDLGWGALVALVIALFGLFIKGKNTEQPKPESDAVEEAKEIIDDHVEEVRKASDSYTNSLARSSRGRVNDILGKFRKRTGG